MSSHKTTDLSDYAGKTIRIDRKEEYSGSKSCEWADCPNTADWFVEVNLVREPEPPHPHLICDDHGKAYFRGPGGFDA